MLSRGTTIKATPNPLRGIEAGDPSPMQSAGDIELGDGPSEETRGVSGALGEGAMGALQGQADDAMGAMADSLDVSRRGEEETRRRGDEEKRRRRGAIGSSMPHVTRNAREGAF
jgi:hypothetical protein